jgi:hypothetical protein
MANNKRPPLEMDDLTNNLKESSGQGIGAFFPAQPTPLPEKPRIQEEQDKDNKQNSTPHPVPDRTSSQYPSETPQKREIKRRQPFDVYHDQVALLKKLSLRDQMNGELGTMSRMVREALDEYLKDKKL